MTFRFGLHIALVVLIAAASFFVYRVEKNNTTQEQSLAELQTRIGSLEDTLIALTQNTTLLQDALQAEALRNEEQEAEAERLAQNVGTLSEHVTTQGTKLTTLSEDTDIPAIVTEWNPYVYAISCDFELADGTNHTSRASATLMREDSGIRLITNKHVVIEEERKAESCELGRFDSDTEYDVAGDDIELIEEKDIAKAAVPDALSGVLPWKVCSERPAIGDSVVILGYPGIGSQESITATEGIISGFDEKYYTTSAKIDRGNSGGAAIDVKNNCFLGIPTLVYTGRVESLARILPVQR